MRDAWVRATWHDASEGWITGTDEEWHDNVVQISAAEVVAWCREQGVELPVELAKIKPGPPPDWIRHNRWQPKRLAQERTSASPPGSSIDKNSCLAGADTVDTMHQEGAADLPKEIGTARAAKILGVSKDTVLELKASGLLEYRNTAPPSSSRPRYAFTLRSVMELRTSYERDEPLPALPKEPRRRQVKRPKGYKHLKLSD